jgi:hypothetical protein
MIRTGIILSILLLILFVGTAWYVSKFLYDQTSQLEGKVNNVQTQTSQLETQTSKLVSDVNNVQTQTSQLEGKWNNVRTQTSKLEDDVTNMKTALSNLESEVTKSQKRAAEAEKALQRITDEARLDVLSFPLMIGPGYLRAREHLQITGPGLATYKASPQLKAEEMKNVKKVLGVWWVPRERPQELSKFVQIVPIMPGEPVRRNANRPLADNEFWIDFFVEAPKNELPTTTLTIFVLYRPLAEKAGKSPQ